MKHSKYKKLIIFSLTGELSKIDITKIKEHIEICPECRKEDEESNKLKLESLKDFIDKPDRALLENSRRDLFLKIRADEEKSSIRQRLKNYLRLSLITERKLIFTGSIALIAGVCIGFFLLRQNPKESLLQNLPDNSTFVVNKPQINNIKFIGFGTPDGNIDFTFDEVITLRMNGNINEPRVQKVLAYALTNEQNPGIKLKTISAINNKTTDIVMKDALIQTMKTDDNPGVRSEAMRALTNLQYDDRIRDALIYVLQNDKNPGLRNNALKCIENYQKSYDKNDKTIYNVLKAKIESDENSYIRYRAKTILEEKE